jgi:hypothetical protein
VVTSSFFLGSRLLFVGLGCGYFRGFFLGSRLLFVGLGCGYFRGFFLGSRLFICCNRFCGRHLGRRPVFVRFYRGLKHVRSFRPGFRSQNAWLCYFWTNIGFQVDGADLRYLPAIQYIDQAPVLALRDRPGLFDAHRVAQAALILRVMHVEPGHPAHLFPIQPVALFPDHLNDGGLVLIGPHDGANADFAHDPCH